MYLMGVGDWRLISTSINETCKTFLLSSLHLDTTVACIVKGESKES